MPILSITTSETGLVSVNPSVIYINTSDTYAQVTATGYLTLQRQAGFTFNNQQMALVTTSDDGVVWLTIDVVGSVVSLISPDVPGETLLPTIANHIIVATDTTGTLANLTGTAINNGSIQAGLSGTAGTLISYPSTASKGSLIVAGVANSGNTNTTISNVAMGQASVISIPDPANAVGHLLVGATATPFVSGNFPKNSGTSGLMIDSGIAVSALAQTANVVLLTPVADQAITIHNLSLTLGNFTAAAGSISATLGSVSAGTTVSAATGISAGLVGGGTAGSLVLYSPTAANGSLRMMAVGNAGNFSSTVSDVTGLGQATVYTLPDPSNVIARILVGATSTPFTTAHILASSGTGGLVADSGIATSAVQLNTNIKAVISGDIGGAGAGPFTIPQAGVVTTSVIIANIVSSSNIVSVAKVTPGTGNFTILFDADPGAACIINYVVFIAQQ